MDYKGDECSLTIIKSDCCESKKLVSLATHGNDQLSVGQMSIEISKAIPQFSDLQINSSSCMFLRQRLSTLQLIMRSVKAISKQKSNQLEQQYEEVFLFYFDDPIADYLEIMSSIKIKIFLTDESWFYHLFKPHFCWLCILLFLGSRSRTCSVNQFLIWLHWKHEFT
jgi:hypothetical protein